MVRGEEFLVSLVMRVFFFTKFLVNKIVTFPTTTMLLLMEKGMEDWFWFWAAAPVHSNVFGVMVGLKHILLIISKYEDHLKIHELIKVWIVSIIFFDSPKPNFASATPCQSESPAENAFRIGISWADRQRCAAAWCSGRIFISYTWYMARERWWHVPSSTGAGGP